MVRKNRVFMSVSIALAAMLVLGCGKKEEDEDKTTELEGTWVGTCQTEDTKASKMTYVFADDKLTVESANYTGATCDAAAIEVKMGISGTFVIEGDAAAPVGAKNWTMTLVSAKVTPATAEKANNLIAGSFCGVTTWAANTEVDVTGKTCSMGESDDGGLPTTAGELSYDIYKLTAPTLLFGKETDTLKGETAATRATELDTDVYTKQ